MNVILITVDSLRSDRVGVNGYERDTTPFLDDFARRNAFFTDAYSPSTHTREAVPSVLTGCYPDNSVSRTYGIRRDTVSQLLDDEGYTTGAFVCSPFFTSANGYTDSFDKFDSNYSVRTIPMLLGYLREILTANHYGDGFELNRRVEEFVEDADEPYFVWAHYMDAHGPYNRTDEEFFAEPVNGRRVQRIYRKAKYLPSTVTDEEHRILVDEYDNGVRRFDDVMRDLFGRIGDDEVRVPDDTAVFITGDHGESFGENERYEHRRVLNHELLHVPLWVSAPDATRGFFERRVSTADILPTVVDWTDADRRDFDGEHLFGSRVRDEEIRVSCLNYLQRREKAVKNV